MPSIQAVITYSRLQVHIYNLYIVQMTSLQEVEVDATSISQDFPSTIVTSCSCTNMCFT